MTLQDYRKLRNELSLLVRRLARILKTYENGLGKGSGTELRLRSSFDSAELALRNVEGVIRNWSEEEPHE